MEQDSITVWMGIDCADQKHRWAMRVEGETKSQRFASILLAVFWVDDQAKDKVKKRIGRLANPSPTLSVFLRSPQAPVQQIIRWLVLLEC